MEVKISNGSNNQKSTVLTFTDFNWECLKKNYFYFGQIKYF